MKDFRRPKLMQLLTNNCLFKAIFYMITLFLAHHCHVWNGDIINIDAGLG